MRVSAIRLTIFAIAFAVTISLASVDAFPPPPKAEKKEAAPIPRPERTPEQVRKILGETVKCSFLDVEIRTALSDLSQQTGLRIKFDGAFLSPQQGEAEQITVSMDTQGMPLKKVLRKLLEPYPMSIGIVGDTLWVSSEEGIAARQLRQYIAVDCKEQPLTELVAGLADKYAVSLVIDAKAKKSKAADTPITLKLDDATLETILRVACEMATLKPVRIGSVIFITAEDRSEKLRDGDNLVPTLPLVPDRSPEPMPAQPGMNQAPGVPMPLRQIGTSEDK